MSPLTRVIHIPLRPVRVKKLETVLSSRRPLSRHETKRRVTLCLMPMHLHLSPFLSFKPIHGCKLKRDDDRAEQRRAPYAIPAPRRRRRHTTSMEGLSPRRGPISCSEQGRKSSPTRCSGFVDSTSTCLSRSIRHSTRRRSRSERTKDEDEKPTYLDHHGLNSFFTSRN